MARTARIDKMATEPFVFRAGVQLRAHEIWCDAVHSSGLCFLSSLLAFPRSLARGGAVLCEERTWRIHKRLHPQARDPRSLLLSPTGRPFALGALRLELFASGALPGAASLWMRLPSGEAAVYAGAPNPFVRPGCDPMQVRAAETLVCHAPLAAISAELPAWEAAVATLQATFFQAQSAQKLSLVLCSVLRTAPALLDAWRTHFSLGEKPIYGHPRVVAACAAYGIKPPRLFGTGRRLEDDAVLLWPLPMEEALPPAPKLCGDGILGVQTYLCTGAVLLPEVVESCRAALSRSNLELSAALPFPDAIDRPGLLRYVAATGAKKLYLTSGYSETLAAEFAPVKLGKPGVHQAVELAPLGPPRQLPLF